MIIYGLSSWSSPTVIKSCDLTGERVGFGRYIGDRTYVSAAQDLSGKRGREVSVDYQLGPDWNITTSTNTTGNNEAGITWKKRYELPLFFVSFQEALCSSYANMFLDTVSQNGQTMEHQQLSSCFFTLCLFGMALAHS
jgi:hypothetical protein